MGSTGMLLAIIVTLFHGKIIGFETILAGTVLFAAASLTGFPPAIDVPNEAASPTEIWEMFKPKVPNLMGPEYISIEAHELTNLKTGEVGRKDDISSVSYTHLTLPTNREV